MNVISGLDRYSRELEHFIEEHELPPRWFSHPDHVALKAYNAADYERLLDNFRPRAEHLYEAYINERRIASVVLAPRDGLEMELKPDTHLFPRSIRWIELMEARPADQSEESVQFDHAEFYFANGIIPIRSALRRRKIPFLEQENPSHGWLSVVFGNHPDELKFTDQSLEQIIGEELKAGIAKTI